MTEALRAVIALAQPPSEEGNAPGRCAVALLRGLKRNGIDVTAVAARPSFARAVRVPADLPVEIVDIETRSSGRASFRSRVRRPRGTLAAELGARVRELAKAADVVHLEETDTAWCDIAVDRPSSIHVHFRTLRDRALPPPWRDEFRFVLEYAAAEVAAARRHRFLVANSRPVAASLHKMNRSAEVIVAPLALDAALYDVAPPPSSPRAGIIGTGNWPPTMAAIRNLVALWPQVHTRVPGSRLLVAGRDTLPISPPAVPAGVDFVGEVPSSAAFLQGLSVLVYPATRGSGMKVKVLEALACGVPVVTTASGAEGIDPNEGVVVCRTRDELVQATISLLGGEDERRARSESARSTFLERYSPEPATRPLAALFRRMVDGGRS